MMMGTRRAVSSTCSLLSNMKHYPFRLHHFKPQEMSAIQNVHHARNFYCSYFGARFLSSRTEEQPIDIQDTKPNELITGNADKREFLAETRMLLDIVAQSLYSNSEVFLRELISNASDALEKLRFAIQSENPNENVGNLEVRISSNKQSRLITIQDNGIGMTKDELISNLGTIARSGSKAFLEELKNNRTTDVSNIIGQFGVGFYSCFMVADKVEVFTKARHNDSKGHYWVYDGSGSYEIHDADNVSRGTKIIVHLKSDCREFADESRIKAIIKKYSNFVNYPIYVNEDKINTIQPLWLMDPKSITKEQHNEFYHFISNSFDNPRFTMQYMTDAPLTIRALLYVPSIKPMITDLNHDCEVALYTRRVLIKNKANEILPKWCNFMKGVVDSEDIPLNISRELLQNSPLIAKLKNVLAKRIIKFLTDKSKKEPEEYAKFYADHQIYIKSGIMYSDTDEDRQDIATLLRYDTSTTELGKTKSLAEYCENLSNDEKNIYYVFAPSRALAESSPYIETLKKRGIEVLFCYELYDEHIFSTLRTFRGKNFISAEEQLKKPDEKELDLGVNPMKESDLDRLISWSKEQLEGKAKNVKITTKLESHPCAITVENMMDARQFLRGRLVNDMKMSDDMKYSLIAPCLELNPKHKVVQKLSELIDKDSKLASLVLKQLFWNALITANVTNDTSSVITNMNELLTALLEKC